jgi:FkbM family methyltransferase
LTEVTQLTSNKQKIGFKDRFHRAWPALNNTVECYSSYAAAFGYARATSIFPARNTSSNLGRRVEVMIPGTDIPLTLRVGTSDVDVFEEIFVNLEYGWVFNSPPRVILDVGGYTGLSAAFFAHSYPEAKIIAVEPDAQNFEMLLHNTAQFPNVSAVRAAAWQESGTISLTDPGLGAWSLQVSDATDALSASDRVRAVTIDELRDEFELDRIDLLKIDVEGSEREIFHTADSWLPFVDVICIELHDRFKTGCSRSFFRAVEDFPIEMRRNEDVLVARPDSPLVPLRTVD